MVAAPIAAAFMLAPAIMLARAPLPIVVMHPDSECRAIIVTLGGVPAIAIAVAADGRRRRRCQGSQHTGARNGAKDYSSDLHGVLHSEVKNRLPKTRTAEPACGSAILAKLCFALERDPDAVAPIAAGCVIAPAPVVIAVPAVAFPTAVEIPIIGMIGEAYAGAGIPRFGMPAIAVIVANHIGGRAGGNGHQGTGAGHGAQKKGLQCHSWLHQKEESSSQT